MITLKKLNNEDIIVNALFIEKIESKPDTMITLISGKQIIVRNSVDEVTSEAIAFYQKIEFKQMLKEINDSTK
jgi:flagellar protein FlbD